MAPSLSFLSIHHKWWCDSHFLSTSTFFAFFASQSEPVNALMHGFPACHLAGEIISGRHEGRKTMMGGHSRAKIISISSEEPSLWQSPLLQFSVRPWWIPAGGTSIYKSFSLKILIIDPESKSLIITSRQTATAQRSVDITLIFMVVYKHMLKNNFINVHFSGFRNRNILVPDIYNLLLTVSTVLYG